MQQWSEQDSNTNSSIIPPAEKFHSIKKPQTETKMPLLKTFIVEADTLNGQYICVSGNCPTLGNWKVNEAFVLTNTNESYIKNNRTYFRWRGTVHLPAEKQILFRYFVAYILKSDDDNFNQKEIFVHSWESHDEPRVVDESQISSSDSTLPLDIYGLHSKQQISKGFLTTECAIQFKMYNNPLKFWDPNMQSRVDMFSVKMTPLLLSKLSRDISSKTNNLLLEDSNSQADDNTQNVEWPIVECVDIPSDHSFHPQSPFGTVIKEDCFHLFQTKLNKFGYTGYRFDIYINTGIREEPPHHLGFTHILPGNMKYSNGVVMCPITSVRHVPIGELKIDYLIIKPTKDIHCSLEKIVDWKSSYIPLDIGHRGSGSSFANLLSDCSQIRENTIASLKEAANKGADFVEFDVQLSSDLVPIIYHDFNVSMAITSKTDLLAENVEMIKVPLKTMSYEQLQKLKIYHVREPYSLSKTHFLNDVRDDYQPFPKLEKAFKDVDIDVGFNVELKWTMKLKDGTYELDNPFDMNLFVDTVLETVYTFAGSRSIVFSCFHPDVCAMLKLKQNRYPVLFLTQGVTKRYPSYDDPRCHTIQKAVYFATCQDLLGVNAHSEDLLRDKTQINIVKEAGLALFCWGNDNNCKEVVNQFKQLGVNAVIYDRLNKKDLMEKKNSCSNNKPDVFIAENYCNQKDILRSQKLSLIEDAHLRENNDREGDNNRYFLDVGKVGFQKQCSSTENLWNEKNLAVNDPTSPKHELNIDQTLEKEVQSNTFKKFKSDVQ